MFTILISKNYFVENVGDRSYEERDPVPEVAGLGVAADALSGLHIQVVILKLPALCLHISHLYSTVPSALGLQLSHRH